jgi:phosphotransferase system HPr (HPr) family protein
MIGPTPRFSLPAAHDPLEGAGSLAHPEVLRAMNGEVLQQKVRIQNPEGFHLRPVAAFAQLATRHPGEVAVSRDSIRVNGKSTLELMMLAAEQGAELVVEVSAPPDRALLDALVAILAAASPEGEDPIPPLPTTG